MAFKTHISSTNVHWLSGRQENGPPVMEEEQATLLPLRPASGCGRAVLPSHPMWDPVPVRYCDQPMSLGTRMFGMSGTGLLCLALIGVALFRWQTSALPPMPTTLSVFDVAPPEAPPAPDTEIPPGPEQVQTEMQQPRIEVVDTPPPLVQVPAGSAMIQQVTQAAPDPGPPVEQTTAPETRPLPPGSKMSDARPTWEGQVLAALNAAKRYPLEARRNRQQGVPWIRFTMDREGKVRSVRLEQSSGFDALDREALALPMRASPLPIPPDSVAGNRVELTVPIEFFMR